MVQGRNHGGIYVHGQNLYGFINLLKSIKTFSSNLQN